MSLQCLIQCLRNGEAAAARQLLESEDASDVNAMDSTEVLMRDTWIPDTGWRPLHFAAEHGYLDIVVNLLERNAHAHAKTKNYGWSPLFVACFYGRSEVAEYLLNNGASINNPDKNGWTPLFVACLQGQTQTALMLLNNGANINKECNAGLTPLYVACENHHAETAQMLVDNGADVNLAKNDAWPPLNIACQNGDLQVMKILLSKGASINYCATDEWTPLFVACCYGQTEAAKLLLQSGASLHDVDSIGWTTLHGTCEKGFADTARMLIHEGAKVNQVDKDGWTPLCVACGNGQTATALMLIQEKADINHATNDGSTPLHFACEKNFPETVKLLVSNGANVNKANKEKKTPLHLACARGHSEVVQTLMKHNCDYTLKNRDGETAIDVAHKNKRENIIKIFNELPNKGKKMNGNTCKPASFDKKNNQTRPSTPSRTYTTRKKRPNAITIQERYNQQVGEATITLIAISDEDDIQNQVNGPRKKPKSNVIPVDATENSTDSTILSSFSDDHNDDTEMDIFPSNAGDQAIHDPSTQLFIACKSGETESIQALLKSGVNVHSSCDGNLPIHIACQFGHLHVVKILIDYGAHLTFPNKDNHSPLHIACQAGHLDVVQLLLDYGVDPNLKIKDQTPADVSVTDEIKQLLRSLSEYCASNVIHSARRVRRTQALPDPKLITIAQLICNIDFTHGLSELASTESLFINFYNLQEQLRQMGNDATVEVKQRRDTCRDELIQAIHHIREPSEMSPLLVKQQSWKESLEQLIVTELVTIGDCDVSQVGAEAMQSLIDLNEAIDETNAAITTLKLQHAQAVVCLDDLQDDSDDSQLDNMVQMSLEAAVRKALRVEIQAISRVPQNVAHQIHTLACCMCNELDLALQRSKDAQASIDYMVKWRDSARPWQTDDPTKLVATVKTAKVQMLKARAVVRKLKIDFDMAEQTEVSMDEIQQLKNELDQQKSNLSKLFEDLRRVQTEAVKVFSLHFPESLSNEHVAEFVSLDGLKRPSMSLDDFTIEQTIVTGRYTVFKVKDDNNKMWALKEYRFGSTTTTLSQDQSDFEQEVKTLHRLRHSSVTEVSSLFSEKGSVYLQTPWYDLGTLADWASHANSQQDLKLVFGHVLRAIEYLHNHGIAHGNIHARSIVMKASTISGCSVPHPVLVGFELTKRSRDSSDVELWTGESRSCTSDMYALGMTIARVYYPDITSNPPVLPLDVDPALSSLVTRLTSKSPRDRPTAHHALMDAYFSNVSLDCVDLNQSCSPFYWNSSLMECSNRVVDVTTTMRASIQRLMSSAGNIGVEQVLRIENHSLWESYTRYKTSVRAAPSTVGPVVTDSFNSQFGLSSNVNETYLFHPAPVNVNYVMLPNRLNGQMVNKGQPGPGFFLDQLIANSVVSESKIVLARVCLGRILTSNQPFQQTMLRINHIPLPCVENCALATMCNHARYDSLRIDVDGHHQFVVYSETQIYPEYIISFR